MSTSTSPRKKSSSAIRIRKACAILQATDLSFITGERHGKLVEAIEQAGHALGMQRFDYVKDH